MIYAICNPVAGNGRGKKVGVQVRDYLHAHQIPCRLIYSETPGHAVDLARAARDAGADTVLAIGGDGTVQEVAQGLTGSTVPLGVVPAGTGNDFIKTLGVPRKPLPALEFILSHPARPTDVGEINGRVFINEIGTGFDVSVLDYALKAKKYCRGLMPYLYGVIKTLFRFRSVNITMSVDGGEETMYDAFVAGVSNGGVIGGGIRIAPDARCDDGLLDVVILDKVKKSRLLARLIGLMRGKILTFPETHFVRAQSVAFSVPDKRVNVDGEIVPVDRVSARILPGALMIHR